MPELTFFQELILAIFWLFCYGICLGEIFNLKKIKPEFTFWDYFFLIIIDLIIAPLAAGIVIGTFLTAKRDDIQ
jgi:predicted membrane protein